MYTFSKRSLDKLKGVDASLVKVMTKTLQQSPIDFCITQGLRTTQEEEEYVKEGKSCTMHSKHLTGKAVDIACIVGGKVTWDMRFYKEVADIAKSTAEGIGVKLTWGGDWHTLVDGCHFEIA